jgi:ribose/xylose/arabinose/galactoside ABC-type transport system permease subunit
MEKKMRSPVKSFLSRLLRSNGFALAVIVVVLGIIIYMINSNFLTGGNMRGSIFLPMVVPGIMLVAVGPLLIGGGIDLASAAQASFASVIFARLLEGGQTMPWLVAALITLACGAGFGLINVFLTNVLNFMPFIATIGMSSIYIGVGSWWTLMNNVAINNAGFNSIGSIAYFSKTVPLLFIFMLLLVAVYSYMLSSTRYGRSVYMCGGNQAAARLAGLNPKKNRATLFINSGVISALAGVTYSAQFKLGNPRSIFDAAPNFSALTALILSGTSFLGGSGGVSAGVIALLLVTVFDNGLTILALKTAIAGQPRYGTYVNTVLKGLILIIALMLDYVRTSRAQRALVAAAMKSRAEKAAV